MQISAQNPLPLKPNTVIPFGFLNCDKPIGMTSRDLVNIVAKRFRETRETPPGEPAGGRKRYRLKMGHCGTLDPLAEGVLVVGVGQAVRMVSYVQQQRKYYRGTFLLGKTSETGDLEGELLDHPKVKIPTKEQLQAAASSMLGSIEQVPPAYSAIKVNGRRAYDLVRAGQDVEMPSRTVQVYQLRVTRLDYPEFDVDVCCGSGTYIRTLGMDLAKLVGSVAVMKSLRRYGVGVFQEADAIKIDQIRNEDPRCFLTRASHAVHELPRIEVDDRDALRLLHGLNLSLDLPVIPGNSPFIGTGKEEAGQAENVAKDVAVLWKGEIYAIVSCRKDGWWPKRVFPRDS